MACGGKLGEFSISQKNSPITDNHAETNRGIFSHYQEIPQSQVWKLEPIG